MAKERKKEPLEEFTLARPKHAPENPYRFPPGDGEKNQNTAALLGLMAESVILRWSNLIIPTPEQKKKLESARTQILEKLRLLKTRARADIDQFKMNGGIDPVDERHKRLFEPYQQLALTADDPLDHFSPFRVPSDPNLRILLDTIDDVLRTSLGKMFKELPDFGENKTSEVRYLVMAAISIAQEITHPTLSFRNGLLHPDIRLFAGKQSVCQLDAVKTAKPTPRIKGSDDFRDFLAALKSQPGAYEIFEAKLMFRERYGNEHALPNARNEHLIEAQVKLLKTALWWKKVHGGAFPFPSAIVFCYLRPFEETIVHTKRIDGSGFLGAWAMELEEALGRVEDAEMKSDLEFFLFSLEKARRSASHKERQRRLTATERRKLIGPPVKKPRKAIKKVELPFMGLETS